MLTRPKLKTSFKYFEFLNKNNEHTLLLSERKANFLNGSVYQMLIPLINGKYTVDEIVDLLMQKSISASEIYYALMVMEKMGYIIDSNECLPSNLEIFCENLNINTQIAYQRLQTTKVAIKSFSSYLPVDEFKNTLESLHIGVTSELGDIEIVLTDDYLHNELKSFNEEALKLNKPWMLVKPVGTIVWIGPIFIPGKTGCWHCLAQRLRNNKPVERFIERHQGMSTSLTPPLGSLATTYQTALGMAATEIFKWIVQGENKRLEGMLVTHDTISLEIQNHVLVKRPQCPCCGNSNGFNAEPYPIVLGHRQKTFTLDGGHRCISPEETFKKYQHHISPLTGVVRGLGKIDQNFHTLIHTYVARHHFATIFDDLNALRQNISGRSAGKGKTDQQAKVSALCEAIERYSGVFQGNENRQTGSYQQLIDKAIHPNACMNFSEAQYSDRHNWNANCSGWFQKIPEPFDEEKEIEWTPVWSLTHQEFKYLPTAYCYYGYPNLLMPECWADSNGCAAGNTLEEAILQGFLELVERDCVALWWYNRLKKPQVDIESFEDPYFLALKKYYQTIHRELWILDITNDLNIPTFAAISRRTDSPAEDIILGFGTHFDPQIAMSRALSEINQILPNVLSANADGSTKYPASSDSLALKWWKTATVENQSYLFPDKNITPKLCTNYPHNWSEDLLEDIMLCQQLVEKNGMEMLVLDQTRADIKLRVVKVIVPGMRHWWRRLGSGRLYDVPVNMGCLKQPLTENQLNPFPMWM
ncbi:TOMM precursor leader peptide-binding protein [Nostoc sp. FACHB-280]|uniref:TOMM precursor leader peptide-binding protein n=1 Tax=Nostoc sp. FACHB-280 TaxID=2692839 RepID=UPI00168ACEE1|nr:TOMM precursor leader peptide-binding protein [Nostoc sp. FACHB-280]MBD2494301.1 TOMM precursor leader peptide-binding protein [Nostoc sp. FACHB-280]